jgi:hypothetical protein
MENEQENKQENCQDSEKENEQENKKIFKFLSGRNLTDTERKELKSL